MSRFLSKEEINKMSNDEFLSYVRNKYPLSEETKREVRRLKYYKIHDLDLIGKCEQGIPYIYTEDKWIVDNENIITDRIMGYDGESIGTSTVHDIIEITSNEAELLIKELYD